MQLYQPFDATQHDPAQGGGGLPVGKYPVRAINSEITATKSGDSGMLVYELEILDGPNKGQTGNYRLNIYNNNPQAKDIANRQLSALCHVTGVFNLQDSAQLHGIPFIIEVVPQKGENADKYTEVKKVYDIQGNEPGKKPTNAAPAAAQAGAWQAPPAQAQAQPPAAAQAAPAWGGAGAPAAQQAPAPAWGAPPAQPAAPPAAAPASGKPAWAQ